MKLLERLQRQLSQSRLIPRGARVVLAVSGGVDSMALLHLLHAMAPDFGWKLFVAHFNHRLRGRSSAADEQLVRAAARRLKLSCDVATADVRKAAKTQGISVEMAARELRHAFLARCARARRSRVVALAHHADDQAELFLLRLMRGAGGEGLGGMKAHNASPADPRATLVRPLLEVGKEEIVEFARKSRLRFREDASNASAEFDRNWVRLELLPLLRRRQPAIVKTILRTMEIVGTEADFITELAESWHLHGARRPEVSLDLMPVALQRRVVQLELWVLGVEPDFQLVESLRTRPGTKVSVRPGVELVCDARARVRRVESGGGAAEFALGEVEVGLRMPPCFARGQLKFGGLRLSWRLVRRTRAFSPQRVSGREYFDAERVGARMVLRHWRAGDRFQPIGMPEASKLQDWFTNRKVPAARRRTLVLAETERGEVFWVEGERIGEVAKVTPATRWLLELKWKQL